MPKNQSNQPQPPNEEKDFQQRVDACNKELEPLLNKYELGFTGIPFISQQGTISAQVIFISTRGEKEPVKTLVEP